MKRVFLLLLWWSSVAFAAPAPVDTAKAITLSFDKINLFAFATFAYGDILKTNFAIHPDLVDSPKLVTVHFQSEFDRPKLASFLVDLFAGVGVTVEQKRGYILLRPTLDPAPDKPAQEIFFYRAKHRPVGMLMDLTRSLFENGRFSTQRSGIKSPATIPIDQSAITGATATTTQSKSKPKTADSGNTAFSQIDKTEDDFFIFQGPQKDIDLLQSLLRQIDTPVSQVLVKGIVYEVTTGAKDASAFTLAMNVLQSQLGASFGKTITGNTFKLSTSGVDAVFSALSTDSRFKSISNPSLRVKSGASARFSVGSDVPVLGVAQLDRNGNPIQSVEYKPSGVIFDIKPQIRDEVIDLTISQQLSTFVTTTTGVNNSPTLIKREIATSIGATDGDVVVLGGLDEDKTTTDSNGLAFLPSWTRGNSSDTSKTQILLILQVQKI